MGRELDPAATVQQYYVDTRRVQLVEYDTDATQHVDRTGTTVEQTTIDTPSVRVQRAVRLHCGRLKRSEHRADLCRDSYVFRVQCWRRGQVKYLIGQFDFFD